MFFATSLLTFHVGPYDENLQQRWFWHCCFEVLLSYKLEAVREFISWCSVFHSLEIFVNEFKNSPVLFREGLESRPQVLAVIHCLGLWMKINVKLGVAVLVYRT